LRKNLERSPPEPNALSFSGRRQSLMMVASKYREILERLGLTSLEQVRRFHGELVKNHRGRRDILRIVAADSAGRPLTLYLKRNWKPYKKDGLASLWRRGRVWSQSRQEWENCLALQRAGVATAELAAWGEECGPLWERFSFILTEAAPGRPLSAFLAECADRSLRRRVIEALADLVRRMHDAGLAAPDLFTRHVFLDLEGERPRFRLIDMARLDRRRLPLRLRARDLAALNAAAPLRHVSARERILFLRRYAGRTDRRLARAVAKRMKRLLKRRKFRDFAAEPPFPNA